MSREELLADAIGSLDEEILLSVNRRRSAADSDANTGGLVLMKDGREKKKRSFRRFWLPLSAALVLVLGLAVAGAATLIYGLRVTENEDGEKVVGYVPVNAECAALSEISGDVMNTIPFMKQRLQAYLAGEPVSTDGMSGMTTSDENGNIFYVNGDCDKIVAFNVGFPGNVYKEFETVDAAEAYIGYTGGIRVPRLSLNPVQIGVYTEAMPDGGYKSATADSEFEMLATGICVGYTADEVYRACSSAFLQFGDSYSYESFTVKDSQDRTYTTETRTVGTKEFEILKNDMIGGFKEITVYYYENKVAYRFCAWFPATSEANVEALVAEWMSAFAN